MILVYKTSDAPIQYKATGASYATLFHIVCTFFSFSIPIIICFFYLIHNSSSTTDYEFPIFAPYKLSYFSARGVDSTGATTSTIYYTDISHTNSNLSISYIPTYRNHRLTQYQVKLGFLMENLRFFTMAFSANVTLTKWSNFSTNASIIVSRVYPQSITSYKTVGTLALEQGEIINFRESFSHNSKISQKSFSLGEQARAIYNSSALFYIDWDYEIPIYSMSSQNQVELSFTIKVKDIPIIHSQPLVSSIETILILFLSTYAFFSFVFRTLQNFVFSKGYIKSWRIPLASTVKKHYD